jgi:hypothetical protein
MESVRRRDADWKQAANSRGLRKLGWYAGFGGSTLM